jgi:hypothetical protein
MTGGAVPEAILRAGANGAGKTTFARQFLQVQYPGGAFLNADEIRREDPKIRPPRCCWTGVVAQVGRARDGERHFCG